MATTLQELFLQFRDECIWLRVCHNTFQELFDSGQENLDLLEVKASRFFHDLNRILLDYCVQLMCNVTDKATTCGRDNLTIEGLNLRLNAEGLMTTKIQKLAIDVQKHRANLKDYRNRCISHIDLQAAMDKPFFNLGTEDELIYFFENLQKYCDEVGDAVGAGPLDFRTVPGHGDAIDLIRCLRGLT